VCDVLLTSRLVEGVDLWLNTPRRPWEASGTSGMKVLVNGGLNLSELDGWWAEAYSPEVGWAIGDGQEHGDDLNWDAHEADTLYDLLEKEVIPAFYIRDDRGIPKTWVTKMRASMLLLTPNFSSNRAVREYVEKYYLPAANNYGERAANDSKLGIELRAWAKSITQGWPSVRFGSLATHREENQYDFQIQVFLGELEPNAVAVELYAEPQAQERIFRQRMALMGQLPDSDGYFSYSSKVPANRPATDYIPRVIPWNSKASVPLEVTQITWQK